ncbi:MAG: ATP-binding cassette domain-containing protein, partial [Cyanobacteria bacterium J06633_23]
MTAAIYFANLQKSYGDLSVLRGINGQIHRGEVVAIIGSSGCGKSTLLRCFNRLETISGGQLIVNDIELLKHHTHLSPQLLECFGT